MIANLVLVLENTQRFKLGGLAGAQKVVNLLVVEFHVRGAHCEVDFLENRFNIST